MNSQQMVELGKRFVALGRALQDSGSTIEEVGGLAFDCGLRLEFRISPDEPQATPDPTTTVDGVKHGRD